jgi:hypothetical protein
MSTNFDDEMNPQETPHVLPSERRFQTAAIDAVLLSMYESVLGADEPCADAMARFCRQLAAVLGVSMVVVSRESAGGIVHVEASSHENALWLDLQRLPERSDEGVMGNASAGRVLRSGQPVVMSVDDEGLLPWRRAAAREDIGAVAAWPLGAPPPRRVLQIYAREAAMLSTPGNIALISDVSARLAQFLVAVERGHASASRFPREG